MKNFIVLNNYCVDVNSLILVVLDDEDLDLNFHFEGEKIHGIHFDNKEELWKHFNLIMEEISAINLLVDETEETEDEEDE